MRYSIGFSVIALLFAACSSEDGASCTPGVQDCNGDNLRTCATNGSSYAETPCDFGCNAGACRACQPGQIECEGTVRRLCNADGTAWTQESCPVGCDSSTKQCRAQVCTPPQIQCSGNSITTCKPDGSGYTTTACQYGCDPATSPPTCKAQPCTPGSTSCNGAKLVTCKADGTGITETPCEFGCDPNKSPIACATAACNVGDKRCSPTNAKQVQTCKPDRTGWLDGTVCPDSCTNGSCGGTAGCTPGEEFCYQNVDFHRDEIDLCKADGTWEIANEVCTAGSCVDKGGTPKLFECGTCWKGERSCSGEDVMECTAPATGATKLFTCTGITTCVGGACGEDITLAADSTVNYKTIAQALVDCWNKNIGGTANAMCYAIDGEAQTQPIAASSARAWVCDTAAAADFTGGEDDLSRAKDIWGCGFWDVSEMSWLWDPLAVGTVYQACIWYDIAGGWFGAGIVLDHCEYYTP